MCSLKLCSAVVAMTPATLLSLTGVGTEERGGGGAGVEGREGEVRVEMWKVPSPSALAVANEVCLSPW